MKWVWALLFSLLTLSPGQAKKEKATTEFLQKQKQALTMIWRLSQPNEDPEQAQISATYNPLDKLTDYKNPDLVQTFFEAVNGGETKQRGQIFNLFDKRDREEAIQLFEILHSCKDWDLFYKTAIFARDRVNEGQFYYAFSIALEHRDEGFILPAPYEIFPHLFTNSDVIRQAYRAKMTQTPAIIPMNYTGTIRNPEQRVSYFGEDLNLNAHHALWHADFPFWWDEAKYGKIKGRRGELFWYMHHQLTVRFDAERLSNGLKEVEELHWDKPIQEGFVPSATYKTGEEFPSRPDNMKFEDLPYLTVHEMKLYEGRIRQGIAAGFLLDENNNAVSLNNTDGISIIGDAIESSADSIHPHYYGSLHNMAHVFLSRVTDPQGKYGLAPGVMEHFETATRDPAFFRLHKYMDNLIKEHKDWLAPYTHAELDFPGVRIDMVEVNSRSKNTDINTLITYFDTSLVDLTQALDYSKFTKDVDIRAQVSHLSHVPFDYTFSVSSNKATSAVGRVFLLLQNNWYGEAIDLEEARWGAIELDKFVVKLMPGTNKFKRSSLESSVTLKERQGYKKLMKEVTDALEGKSDFMKEEITRHCGHPQGLLIPKGNSNGMQFRLFVVLTDYEKDIHADSFKDVSESPHSYCGNLNGDYPDRRPMGFPFDRKIKDVENFKTDNMKDIIITIENRPLAKVDFSVEEISAIKSTWSVIKSDPTGNGVTAYLHWMASQPEKQANFKKFANVPREQLADNEAFKRQATATINRLSDILSSIESEEELNRKMTKLAEEHKFRDSNVKDFRDMTNILMDVFSKIVANKGDTFSPPAISGYKKVFARLLQKIEDETVFTHSRVTKVQLTPEESLAVKATWSKIQQDLVANAMDMYLAWFTKYPQMQKAFAKFADVPQSELRDNKAFQIQAQVTLERLNDMLESIDSPAEMAGKMKRLGRVHQGRPANVYDFRDMTRVFMEVMGSKLGSLWSSSAQTGWAKVFATLVENVGDGLSQKI